MKSEELAQLRYQEMCRIVGDVVFAMVAEGHETKRVAIADVIRTEIAKGLDKWDDDQLQCMKLAVKLLEEQVSLWLQGGGQMDEIAMRWHNYQ